MTYGGATVFREFLPAQHALAREYYSEQTTE